MVAKIWNTSSSEFSRLIVTTAVVFCLGLPRPSGGADEFNDGQEAYARQDYAHAVELWRPLAEKGNLDAQLALGSILFRGKSGVPRDYVEAAKWFRKAAKQGAAGAQTVLGHLYSDGQGVPQDYALAVVWFRKAANQGDAEAELHLGRLYLMGRGIKQDSGEGAKWVRLAAEQGQPDAQYMLGLMHSEGFGVPKDHCEAIKWNRRAAEQGQSDARLALRRPEMAAICIEHWYDIFRVFRSLDWSQIGWRGWLGLAALLLILAYNSTIIGTLLMAVLFALIAPFLILASILRRSLLAVRNRVAPARGRGPRPDTHDI